MKRRDEQLLRSKLQKLLADWWGSDAIDHVALPYVGDNTIILMTDAAINVLIAVDDVYETLRSNGELVDPE